MTRTAGPKAPVNVRLHLTPFDPTIKHTTTLSVRHSRGCDDGLDLYLQVVANTSNQTETIHVLYLMTWRMANQ
jgi:hypothetical protein